MRSKDHTAKWRWRIFARRDLVCQVEGVRGNHVCGYAFRRASPSHRLWISANTSEGSVGFARADIYRADVQRAHLGHNGYCGFAFPRQMLAGHDVRLIDADSGHTIAARLDLEMNAPVAIANREELVFGLDQGHSRLSGWVYSKSDPHVKFRLRITNGARLLAEQYACLYRSDLANSVGDPFHGFSFLLPPHAGRAEIREAKTDQLLHRVDR